MTVARVGVSWGFDLGVLEGVCINGPVVALTFWQFNSRVARQKVRLFPVFWHVLILLERVLGTATGCCVEHF